MLQEYIHRFNNEDELNEYVMSSYTLPFVSTTVVGTGANSSITVNYNLREIKEYLTFEIVSGGTLYWKAGNTAKTIEVQINDGEWTSITSSSDNGGSGTTIGELVTGDIIKFRAVNGNYGGSSISASNRFTHTPDFCYYAYGNIMSIINQNNYVINRAFSNGYTFRALFYYNNIMIHPYKQLLFPATTIQNGSYMEMFICCRKLTKSPSLPAKIMKEYCYESMFSGCTSLEKLPELPATVLAVRCYSSMFQGCNKITEIPDDYLPLTTLYSQCYAGMFYGCKGLTDVSNLKLPATTLAARCYTGMFWYCSNLTKAPELPAPTLVDRCYTYLFEGCTKLNYIKCLATDISANVCTNRWTTNVAASGTFVKHPDMENWTTGRDGIPSNWTVENAT